MDWLVKRHKLFGRPLVTASGGALLVLLSLVLVAAPLHEAAHRNHASQHPCVVCSFAKSLVDVPQLSVVVLAAVFVGFGRTVLSVLQFVPPGFFLLPPGRAPPVLKVGF